MYQPSANSGERSTSRLKLTMAMGKTRLALAVAERVRHALRALELETDTGTVRITASIGVAEARGTAETLDGLLKRADAALYEAKAAGRDCVRGCG